MRVPFTITSENITLSHKGKIFNIPSTYRKFEELKDHLRGKNHDLGFIETIVNIRSTIERLSKGNISVFGDEVYFKNTLVRNTLTERLIMFLDDGFDIDPWVNFMENVMQNPSDDSRERLFTFLEKNNSPFTEDGHFLAFKRIGSDFKDLYTHTMDNSPGKIVEVDRSKVDSNNRNTCSHGLHVAASIYLDSYANASNSKTIVCKVNPRDVVAVPPDYNETKMRVCRYEVLSEVEVGEIHAIEEQNLHRDPSKQTSVAFEDIAPVEFMENEELKAKTKDLVKTKIRGYNPKYIISDIGIDVIDNTVFVSLYDTWAQFTNILVSETFYKNMQSDLVNLSNAIFDLCDDIEEIVFSTEFTDVNVDTIFDIETNTFTDTITDKEYSISEFNRYGISEISYIFSPVINNTPTQPVVAAVQTPKPTGITFFRNGVTYTQKEVLDGIGKFGSTTKWAKSVGIPRSTAQDWVARITR